MTTAPALATAASLAAVATDATKARDALDVLIGGLQARAAAPGGLS